MRVGLEVQARQLVRLVGAPDLREREKEPLLLGKPRLLRQRSAIESRKQRHRGKPQTTGVGRIFTQRKLAALMQSAGADERPIFVNQTLLALIEGGAIGRRPPVIEVAFAIEL